MIVEPVVRFRILALACASCAWALPALASGAEVEGDGLPDHDAIVEQARAVFEDLAGNSDPLVRRVVFDGRMLLGKKDREEALGQGIADGDAGIRDAALGGTLTHKDKKLRLKAREALIKLLASADEDERARGRKIVEVHIGARKDALAIYENALAEGGPQARQDARSALIASGGKAAWKILAQGLAEESGSPEYAQALEAFSTYEDPLGADWAMRNMHDPGELGELSRKYLVRVTDKKASKKIDRDLGKKYDRGEFAERVDVAWVLAQRGQMGRVQRTLAIATKPTNDAHIRELGWRGLENSRDLSILGKLRQRLVLNTKPREADGAVAWLRAWAGDTGEPKAIEVLQEIARGERKALRLRAFDALAAIRHRPSVAIFEAALSEGQLEMRRSGARGLAAVSKPEDIARLTTFLRKASDPEVKLALIEAFRNIGTPEIIDPLQFVITAPQPAIKKAAIAALEATGKPRAITLLGLLKRDNDLEVRFLAWKALLRKSLDAVRGELPSTVRWLTPSQVEALAADDSIPVEALFVVADKGNDEQRPFAVDGLRRRGDDVSATKLLTLVEQSRDPSTAAMSLDALAEIRKEQSVATYRKAGETDQTTVRAAAIRAMGTYGPSPLLEIVLPAISDKEPLVRANAAVAAIRLSIRRT